MAVTRRSLLAAPALLAASAKPNVLIILTDDQGYGDFSCHGNPVLRTPNMDRLHNESVRFTDFHVAPMCTPTRGQLLTGLDALHNRATSVTAGRAVVQKGIPLMPEIFKANGYSTGLFGKWHIGDNYPYRPMDRGFDEAKYHLGWGLSSAPEFDNDYFNGRYRHNGVVKQFDGYCTDFWFREAMTWMQQQRQPFLCYLPTNAPHGPLWVDPKYSEPYAKPGQPAAFFGMVANLDENLGRLESFLQTSGLRDNTIVIFMTDNGATAGRNVFNAGMREAKTSVYDGGHRVPCFVRWPKGGLRAPTGISTPTQVQDILPTLIDLCELRTSALKIQPRFDGRSLVPLLRNTAPLADRMMVVQYGQILKPWDSNVIWNQWRLVRGQELYDFREDPGEKINLANAVPQVVARMRAHYEQWWAKIEPTLTDFCPITIGSAKENPVYLSSSDWEEIYCDNHLQVSNAAGGPRGGPWNIEVERAGAYEIALARWPFERNLPLSAACPEKKMTVATLPAGKPLPIAAAQLKIGAGPPLAAPAAPDAHHISFQVRLPAGRTKLHGWFQDSNANDLSGAFYARVMPSAGVRR